MASAPFLRRAHRLMASVVPPAARDVAVNRLILAAALLGACGIAAAAPVPTFSTASLSSEVKTLSSDAFEGRGPATPAEQRTIACIVRQFEAAGVQPGGDLKDGKRFGMHYTPDAHPEAGCFFRSDRFPFAKLGVPAIWFGPGEDLVDRGTAAGRAAAADFTATRYHQPGDKWQASWPFTGMAQDLQVRYVLGSGLADSRQWPNRSRDSEFRAARDATAAERTRD